MDNSNYFHNAVSKDGGKLDPEKSNRSMPAPTSVHVVRGFIGMGRVAITGRLSQCSKIAEPMIPLTKKYAKFKWKNECQETFDYLKDSLTIVPALATRTHHMHCTQTPVTCV